jgi:hypothetical protein
MTVPHLLNQSLIDVMLSQFSLPELQLKGRKAFQDSFAITSIHIRHCISYKKDKCILITPEYHSLKFMRDQ